MEQCDGDVRAPNARHLSARKSPPLIGLAEQAAVGAFVGVVVRVSQGSRARRRGQNAGPRVRARDPDGGTSSSARLWRRFRLAGLIVALPEARTEEAK